MSGGKRTALICTVVLVAGGIAVAVKPSLVYPFFPDGKARVFTTEYKDSSVWVEYPEFGRRTVDAAITAFPDDLAILQQAHEDDHEPLPGEKNSVIVTYRVVWRTWRYASVVFDVAVRHDGRGYHYVRARTYDLFRDREVVLDDLGPQADVVAATAVREGLQGVAGVDKDLMDRGLGSGRESFEEFTLAAGDTVVFYLNPGQVRSPEQDTLEVSVPRRAF